MAENIEREATIKPTKRNFSPTTAELICKVIRMYGELIKVLRRCVLSEPCEGCPYYDPHGPTEKCATLNIAAADAIENLICEVADEHNARLDAEERQRWIPVTERLPEAERKSFWVCTDTGYQCECRWTNDQFGIRELNEWGWCLFDIPPYQKVVAWMPLPCPYEPPEEET